MIRHRKKPNASARDLEKLAVRIHKLIEPNGAVVTWNRRIRDPDTGRLRQIDGMIERDGKKTHIECRDHGAAQDVQWIEELIGRRESLRADGMIGVSLSGFTRPAETKAKASGVILRSFSQVTDTEIESWGKSIKIDIRYIEILFLEIVALIDLKHAHLISSEPRLKNEGGPTSPEFFILQELIKQGGDHFVPSRSTTIHATVEIPNLFIDDAPIVSCRVKLRGILVTDDVNVIGVWNYHGVEPGVPVEAVVSKHGESITEIIRKGDNAVMLIDFSSIVAPENCFFHTFQVDLGRNFRVTPEVLGIPHRYNFTINAKLSIKAIGRQRLVQQQE